ncbi:MAG: DUF6600 domain-containing protein [Candidatus Aminicenantales bacterium]
MIKKCFYVCLAAVALLAATTVLGAGKNYKMVNGPDKFYLGHISYTEAKSDGNDPVVIRDGQAAAEAAVLNLPLGPGDTIRTTADRRCEIQFDTGTIIRLDFSTELKIETVLAQSLSSSKRLSNLTLSKGRLYVMYREYDSREMFQVLTPTAAVKLDHKTVAIVAAAPDGSTDAQVKYGKANVLFGPSERSVKKENIRDAERLIVLKDSQFQRATYIADSEFEVWNNDINAHFGELHKGQTGLPKPLQKLPDAVAYFAQQYGNTYGEWLWDDMYGYVWRPFLDRMDYPGWRPYYVGSWTSVGGQLYWVPDEPWGWVPYHLGIWQWDAKLGWVWLPGSLFAPAWVDWEFFYGYLGWRPWSLFDWYDDFYTGFEYFGGAWDYIVPEGPWMGPHVPGRPVLGSVTRNQLQRPRPGFPIPGEFLAAYKNVTTAYKNQDPRAVQSSKQIPSHTLFVSTMALNGPKVQGRALNWENLPKLNNIPPVKTGSNMFRQPARPADTAARLYRGTEAVRQLLHGPSAPGRALTGAAGTFRAPDVQPRAGSPAQAPALGGPSRETLRPAGHPRFLDWNPDLKVARELGVRIEYSSGTNEIRCPELRLSSRDRERGDNGPSPAMTSRGVTFGSGDSGGSGAYRGSGGSSDGGRGAASGSASGGVQGSTKEGSSSSGGGKIKN